ncbi:hypothetical protein HDF19_09065 [Mucilaginibacter sp. E4BP6]|uniref:hypothetical protein n=1 Tax=Mucilaginibacter sp. E4BP6 TaxID=2723089 RepID=UPI0015CAB172|nr:hypothetical protein [Mucilaginibacter sp. E4BP6]NYE67625.1 hypothetical protein [Mucilaginibacter sp. E4BP6]
MTFLLGKSTTHRSPQNSASAGSATTPEVKALTFKEAGAAESFLWLLSFAEKESDNLALAIPEKGYRHA